MLEEAADGTLPGPNSRVSGRGGTLLKTGVCEFRPLATDVDLQGKMSGWDLALRAREVDPAFPVVCMTGAAAAEWALGAPNSICSRRSFNDSSESEAARRTQRRCCKIPG
jgi:hypothetical protein